MLGNKEFLVLNFGLTKFISCLSFNRSFVYKITTRNLNSFSVIIYIYIYVPVSCLISRNYKVSWYVSHLPFTFNSFKSLCFVFILGPDLICLKEIINFLQAKRTYQWLFSMQKWVPGHLVNFTQYCLKKLKMGKFCMFCGIIFRYRFVLSKSILAIKNTFYDSFLTIFYVIISTRTVI